VVVVGTASWQKVMSSDPRIGFLALATATDARVAAGELAAEVGRQVAFNARLDAALAALFALVTGWVVLAAAREWWLVLQGRKPAVAQETPFVESAYAS
jgi:carbon starvation protein